MTEQATTYNPETDEQTTTQEQAENYCSVCDCYNCDQGCDALDN